MSILRILILLSAYGCANVSLAQSYAFITNQGDDSVSVINTSTSDIIKTIKVGHRPAGVVVSNDGRRVYVTNPESQNVSPSMNSNF